MKLLPPSNIVRQPALSCVLYHRHVRLGSSSSITRALSERVRRFSVRKIFFLSPQSKFPHNFMVTLDIDFFQIIEQTASLRDHLKQSSPRMIVFLMRFEMLCQLVDALAQQGDLNRGRPGVGIVSSKIGNDFSFCLSC